MRITFLTWLVFFISVITAPAQQYNLKTWTSENGLPQAEVTCMLQGHRGFLWIGTMGGLAAFDGLKFRTFTKEDGLGSNTVSCIYQTRGAITWVGSYSNGLSRFGGGNKFTHYGEAQGLPPGGVFSLTEDRDNRLWVATSKGLYYFENERFHPISKNSGVPAVKFWTILADNQGNLWMGTLGNGLYRYNGKRTEHFLLDNGLSNKIVYSLHQSKDGNIWIGTYGGFTKYDGRKFTPYYPGSDLNVNRCMDIAEDDSGMLWFALDGGGLLSFDGKKIQRLTKENGLAGNYLHSLCTDREGNIWLGTLMNGLQRYTPSSFTYYTEKENIRNPNIRALNLDRQGNLWVGTFDAGVGVGKGMQLKWFDTSNGLPNNIINHISNAPDGTVWLATNDGISQYNGKTFKNYTFNDGLIFNIANFILPETATRIWIATNEGLSLLENNKFRNFKISSSPNDNFINCLYKDRQNRLWLGTKSGLFYYQNGQFKKSEELEKLGFTEITSITQDFSGSLWVGSYDHGLTRYAPHQKANMIDHIAKERGLLSESVTVVQIDSLNQLWVGTIKGLNRLNLAEYYKNHDTHLKHFTYTEGFRGIEVNSGAILPDKHNTLWFGTVNGLVNYNPAKDNTREYAPYLNIIEMRLFGEPINWMERGYTERYGLGLPKNPKLDSDDNHITFDYRGILLTNPEKVTYRVKLEGFDKRWSAPTTSNTAIYSNLPPGHYTFMVKACIDSDVCSDEPATYTFTINPPFWSNDRIVGISVLLAAFFAFGLVRWREQNLKRLNTLLEESVEQRTRLLEKKNNEKEILLKEVHHRVKNNLQIITSLLNLQTRHVSDPAALHTLREIKDRIKSISMLHQRLYQREELSCIDLSEYVQTLCRSLFASYGVREDHVRLEFDIPTLYLDIDTALTLGLIVNELVSNTLKYAFPEQRKGTLLIELLRVTETDYTLTISDDGTGLPDNFEEKMATSFGLQLVSSLVKKLHGKLRFYSEGGTQIRLQFIILPQ